MTYTAPVVTATAQLLALDRQPLPAGYGFALFNREGRVLYHSDRRLSLRENFFDELSNGARARALMYAAGSGHMSGRYRERPHAFFFQPLALLNEGDGGPGPFYLAAFRDTSIERALIARIFVAGVGGPMMLLLAMYAAALWAISVFRVASTTAPASGCGRTADSTTSTGGRPRRTGAPARRHRGDGLHRPRGHPGGRAALAAAIGIAAYAYRQTSCDEARKLSAGVCHTCALLLLLVCMIVAPTTALFRLVMNHELGRLIWTERASIRDQEADAVRAPRSTRQRTLRELQKPGAGGRPSGLVHVRACTLRRDRIARDEPEVRGQ